MVRSARLQLFLLPVVAVVVLGALASAQTTPPPAQATPPAQTSPKPAAPPAPAMAPDQKAYSDATAIKDPDKKIEGLEKFMKDFPNSPGVSLATRAIFDTMVKNHPDQAARIREAADRAISKASSDAMRASYYNAFGKQLFDAGILLDEAEQFISKGIVLADEQARRAKAPYQATLGHIYLKQGKLNEAEKILKEALAANPQLSAASLGMAELYEKRGDANKALTNYINAAATSKIPALARKQLEALFAKSHRGSTAGLEEMLDARYLEVNPEPFAVEHYQPTEKRSDRVVLAEVFTGSGCPPCVAADLAADLAMERYGRDLTVLMYHQHIPQPDPMTSAQTSARFKYYAGSGVPAVVIDGVTSPGGGGAREATRSVYDRISKEMEKRLEAAAGAQLKLDVLLDGSIVRTNAVVGKVTGESPDLKLHIVLAEARLRYTGENGVRFHPMVVRSIATSDSGSQGLPITTKDSQTFAWDFKLDAISAEIKKNLDDYEKGRTDGYTFNEKKYEINPKDLLVVAFVQDEKTKAILQSIQVKVNAP